MRFDTLLKAAIAPTLLLPIALISSPVRANPTIAVNWSQPTGKVATPLSYGLNGFQAFSPNVAGTPGNAIYKSNVESMRPGILRYHNMQMMNDSRTDTFGWIIAPETPQYQWDRIKITNAFAGSYSFRPVIMLSIPSWPKALDDGTGKLKSTEYAAFAQFCADLVRIVNIDLKRGVTYWEVTNEKDGNTTYGPDMTELGRIYNQAAQAMKAVDPTIKVGGPAFTTITNATKLDSFLSIAHPHLDFLSYHSYSTGSKTNPVTDLWKSAAGLGDHTGRAKRAIAKFTPRAIETFHNEFNISWAPPDVRMTNQISAVYDAIAMIAITNSGATGSMAWNESDGWYGKLENQWGKWARRPSSYVYQLFNSHLQGAIVNSRSSDSNLVMSYAVKSANKEALALVNRSQIDRTLPITFTGWSTPVMPGELLTIYTIGNTGYITQSATLTELANGYPLPADAVTVITRSR